jgi:hypothetical protein
LLPIVASVPAGAGAHCGQVGGLRSSRSRAVWPPVRRARARGLVATEPTELPERGDPRFPQQLRTATEFVRALVHGPGCREPRHGL